MPQCGRTPVRRDGRGVFARFGRVCGGFALLLGGAALSGCGVAGDAFGGYDLPETVGEVSEGPWPRLADHDFPTGGPDPAAGEALIAELTIDAAAAAARAEALAGPIMTEAEARRLRDAGRRSR